MIIFAQILHAATYGAHHITAMMIIHHFFRGRHQAKGQAIYSSIVYGLGGSLGAILSGYAWEEFGPEITFSISAAVVAISLVLTAWKMKSIYSTIKSPV